MLPRQIDGRLAYRYNAACPCVVCRNNGTIPWPGAAETLGYAQPHIPPGSRPPWDAR